MITYVQLHASLLCVCSIRGLGSVGSQHLAQQGLGCTDFTIPCCPGGPGLWEWEWEWECTLGPLLHGVLHDLMRINIAQRFMGEQVTQSSLLCYDMGTALVLAHCDPGMPTEKLWLVGCGLGQLSLGRWAPG